MILTDEGLRIDVPLTDSLHRRNTVVKECYLVLYDRYIEYKCVGTYESDDTYGKEDIWIEVRSNYRWTRLRSNLSQVDMYYDNPQDKWMVSIEFGGVADPTGWLFESPKAAKKVYDLLQEYFITRPNS